jgi:hypothetical protein
MSAHPDAFPLLFRAWVYQERLLSTRVLHFGAQELSWECNQALICECGYTNSSQAKGMSRDPKSMLSKLLENYVFNTGLPRIQSLWRRIVSDYSALKLTKYSDRLHAIAGLAKSLGALQEAFTTATTLCLWHMDRLCNCRPALAYATAWPTRQARSTVVVVGSREHACNSRLSRARIHARAHIRQSAVN